MLAALTDLAAVAPVAFLAGVLVGLILAGRYSLTRRNGRPPP